MPTLYLLDISSFIFRAYYALTPLSNSKGEPTHAVLGVTQMILKFLSDFKPEYFVALFDRKEENFRKKKYDLYKAQRKSAPPDLSSQIDRIKQVLSALNIASLDQAGFEADDLIATLALHYEKLGYHIVILSSDKDLMQLVSEKISLFDTMKNKWFKEKEVKEKFKVKASQVCDVLALAGDSSDNIPGVKGIGQKTASDLINQYHSLENLYDHLEEIKGSKRKLLEENKDMAFLSKELVCLDANVPIQHQLDDFKVVEFDLSKSQTLFKELEFSRLLNQFQTPNEEEEKATSTPSQIKRDEYQIVQNSEQLKNLLSLLTHCRECSIDTETNSLDIEDISLVGISIAILNQSASIESHPQILAYYIPLMSEKESDTILDKKKTLEILKPYLENENLKKIGQNIKFDIQVFKKEGIALQGIYFDTMLASYLLEPAQSHALDFLSQKYLSHTCISYNEVSEKNTKTFDQISLDVALAYAAEDADCTYRLYLIFKDLLIEKKCDELFYTIEMPLVNILAEMEYVGIGVNSAFLNDLKIEFAEKLNLIEKNIYENAQEVFNIQSPKQLAVILFEKLKLPTQKKTKTGYSTDVETLEKLAELHPLPKLILQHRSLAKLQNTYVEALLELSKKSQHIHTHFNQALAETGRLSSSDPNLQNIPIKTEEGRKIRKAFCARPPYFFVSADYSQIELRILAHLSKDQNMIRAFQQGHDIHNQSAAKIFSINESEVNYEMRQVGKTVNFGVVYGQSAFSLAQQLHLTNAQAKSYIEAYYQLYPDVLNYKEKILEEARAKLEVRTLYYRRRALPDLISKNFMLRAMAERMAFNTVVQGSAADLIKLAMIKISQSFKDDHIQSRLLLQVHDELLFEVEPSESDHVIGLIKNQMQHVCQLSVPLCVDICQGKSWAELKK